MAPSSLERRRWLKRAMAISAGPLAAAFAATVIAADSADEATIAVVAKRFQYEPNEIRLKAGTAAVLAVTSLDFVHGMKIPDLNMRADLPPGRVTKIRVRFDKPGEYPFLCDNFCGDGHEEMAGKFVVA